MLALLAALVMAMELVVPGHSHAGATATGVEMVICSGEGTVTILLDQQGNPLGPSGDELCDCGCACCPSPNAPFLAPEAATAGDIATLGAHVCPSLNSTVRADECGRFPVPRGPPTEKEA